MSPAIARRMCRRPDINVSEAASIKLALGIAAKSAPIEITISVFDVVAPK